MRAAVLRNGVVEARETSDPVPGPGQILVRSRACGICASDLHFMDHPEGDADDDSGLSNHDPDADSGTRLDVALWTERLAFLRTYLP